VPSGERCPGSKRGTKRGPDYSRAFGKEATMEDDGPKFIIFGDVFDGYWWRLRSAEGQAVETSSGLIHLRKTECEREAHRLKEERYPSAKVRDATIG